MKALLDSDTLFSLYIASDIHHNKAKKLFQKLLDEKAEMFVTNLVLQETATVLSYRFGQQQAKDFLNRFNKIDVKQVFVDQQLTAKAWEVFKKQTRRGTSFIDCANVAIYQEKNGDKIFSFDKIYQRLGVPVLG